MVFLVLDGVVLLNSRILASAASWILGDSGAVSVVPWPEKGENPAVLFTDK
jgi:hypothetical protein